ncbi:uncharacterized protein LOC120303809 [Crotalus tigris]|uniref:uncharacterized protein LOC120303809 n=1 Tax=Crotalus tigris TaxID=88082 RepID=UPI00192F7A71|nr:uncharacterized protein LOC120303809 [Crotalus tigris]
MEGERTEMSRRWQRAGPWRGPAGVSGCASCQPRLLFPEANGSEFLAAHTGAARGASATRSASLHGNSYAGEGARAFPPAAAATGSAPAWRAPRDTPLPSPRPPLYQSGEKLRSPAMVSWRYFRVSIGTESGREGKDEGKRAGPPCLGGGGEFLHRVLSRMVARHKSVRADAARKGSSSPSSRSISFPTNPPHLHLQSSSPLPAIESTLALEALSLVSGSWLPQYRLKAETILVGMASEEQHTVWWQPLEQHVHRKQREDYYTICFPGKSC